MKQTTLTLVIIILLIIIGGLITWLIFGTDTSKIDELTSQIEKTRAKVDSLQNENRQLLVQVDSLRNEYEDKSKKIQQLTHHIAVQRAEYEKTLRRLREYKGTDKELLNELNRIMRLQLADSTNQ